MGSLLPPAREGGREEKGKEGKREGRREGGRQRQRDRCIIKNGSHGYEEWEVSQSAIYNLENQESWWVNSA